MLILGTKYLNSYFGNKITGFFLSLLRKILQWPIDRQGRIFYPTQKKTEDICVYKTFADRLFEDIFKWPLSDVYVI